jgi:hypothetical protein
MVDHSVTSRRRTILDLTGRTFGRLTVLSVGEHQDNRPACFCRCECGKHVVVQRKKLVAGHTQSCGCLQRQRQKENSQKMITSKTTHGLSRTKEWRAWMGIKIRTKYVNPRNHERYLGRGIRMAPEWQDDFEAFLAHIGPAPSDSHSVDRIDNDGHYEPGNVKWSTTSQQGRNKSDNIKIVWNGVERLLIEVTQELGLPYQTIWYRIKRAGWTAEQAITQSIRRRSVT